MIKMPRTIFDKRTQNIPAIRLVDDVFIAGGACRKFFLAQKQDSDVDLFFKDEAAKKAQIEALIKDGGKVSWANDTTTTIKIGDVVVQCVGISFYPTIEDVLKSFDFTICQFGFTSDQQDLYATEEAVIDAARHRLVFTGTLTFPVATLRRIQKYVTQGFKPCPAMYRALCVAIHEMPDEKMNLTVTYVD